jgi:hypothetical protein
MLPPVGVQSPGSTIPAVGCSRATWLTEIHPTHQKQAPHGPSHVPRSSCHATAWWNGPPPKCYSTPPELACIHNNLQLSMDIPSTTPPINAGVCHPNFSPGHLHTLTQTCSQTCLAYPKAGVGMQSCFLSEPCPSTAGYRKEALRYRHLPCPLRSVSTP